MRVVEVLVPGKRSTNRGNSFPGLCVVFLMRYLAIVWARGIHACRSGPFFTPFFREAPGLVLGAVFLCYSDRGFSSGTTISPGCPHFLPHAPPRMPHHFAARSISCRLWWSVRSAWWGVVLIGLEQIRFPYRGLALHSEVRFAWSWVGYPS